MRSAACMIFTTSAPHARADLVGETVLSVAPPAIHAVEVRLWMDGHAFDSRLYVPALRDDLTDAPRRAEQIRSLPRVDLVRADFCS
jgi:hypothetical protein